MKITDITEEITDISPAILRYIQQRLDEWANWNLKKDHHGLGYPSSSTEYRIMTLGCIAPEKPGPKPLPVNDEADEIEAIIRIMAKQDKTCMRYAEVLREYYLGRSRRNQEKSARCIGMSTASFQRYFQGAYSWLSGWFTRDFSVKVMIKLSTGLAQKK